MPSQDPSVPENSPAKAAPKRLEILRAFLRKDPSNSSIRAEIFDLALASGAFSEAQEFLAQWQAENPGDLGWRHREGLLFLARGEFLQARQSYLDLTAEVPEDPAFRFNLAFAHFGLGAFPDAIRSVEPLLQEGSHVEDLAWPLWLRCQHHLAQIQEGLEAFGAALTRRLMGAEAWGVASLMALDDNRMQDALAWSEQALRTHPDQKEALITQGTLALAAQDPARALETFKHVLAQAPGEGRSLSGTGFAYMLGGDFVLAGRTLREALDAIPNHIGTWIGLGWCEFFRGDVLAARKAFEEALALDRNFAESHGGLAVALAALGHEPEARKSIALALKLNPLSLSPRYAEALLSGEAADHKTMQHLAQRVLSQVPAKTGVPGQTLADLILRRP